MLETFCAVFPSVRLVGQTRRLSAVKRTAQYLAVSASLEGTSPEGARF